MECRGTKRRQWIIDNYNVVPVAHIQLLTGQTKHSDAGAKIENDYYIFNAVDKITGRKEIIQCGMDAAKDFLKILGIEGLPLFNPLHGEGGAVTTTGKTSKGGGNSDKKEDTIVWNPVAKQLYNAIMWLIIIIDGKSEEDILNVHEGRWDFNLTDKGYIQAAAMAEYVSEKYNIDKIYVSALKRAVQ